MAGTKRQKQTILGKNQGKSPPFQRLVELRRQHEQGNKNAGLDVYSGKVVNMAAEGIIEPLRVKIQAIDSATGAAEMILKIDDVISAGKEKPPAPMPEEY